SETPRKKVGLALSGGAARGLAHIGVLQVLEREQIPVDLIAGTSIGALIGAFYAAGNDAASTKRLALELAARRRSLLFEPVLPRTGFIRGRKLQNTLKSITGDIEFKDLKIPVVCVATDIDSGEEIVIRQGPVWEAVRASITIPVVMSVTRLGGRYLVDGGLVNPVPVSCLKAMGADVIIAVSVPHISTRRSVEARAPNMLSVMLQTINIANYCLVQSSLAGADVVIEPPVGHIAFTDFRRAEECISLGEQAALRSIPEIRKCL
ncbi:MAG: patatin-like phospholipase family protein, partial [Dehalococcoidales bacterium]|nr:patatin-like phospholipase family protein [Dehalococcoidales bacterium]